MALALLSKDIWSEIENELQKAISISVNKNEMFLEMITYHLGWTGDGAGPEARGKRIRPLLTALVAETAGGDWRSTLPAAVSVELIHNFSLIHDDIEDESQERRGRPTVWARWGVAHAINAGDLMFALAFKNLDGLKGAYSDRIVLEAYALIHEACVALTHGQYLDMSFERINLATLDDYWRMISGKTAALLAASTQLGALLAGTNIEMQNQFRKFGLNLGLGFQVWDDWLGIWGNEKRTGKSTRSDLVSRKKTFPIVYGLAQQGEFAKTWFSEPITEENVDRMASLLSQEGAEEATLEKANELTSEALRILDEFSSERPAYQALTELTELLLNRQN